MWVEWKKWQNNLKWFFVILSHLCCSPHAAVKKNSWEFLLNEILFSLFHLVNSLIKSKTLQQLVKKTFVDTKSVLFCLMKIWNWGLKGWILSFVDSNPKCYKLSCCGSCSLGFFSFIQIALARLSLWNSN